MIRFFLICVLHAEGERLDIEIAHSLWFGRRSDGDSWSKLTEKTRANFTHFKNENPRKSGLLHPESNFRDKAADIMRRKRGLAGD